MRELNGMPPKLKILKSFFEFKSGLFMKTLTATHSINAFIFGSGNCTEISFNKVVIHIFIATSKIVEYICHETNEKK